MYSISTVDIKHANQRQIKPIPSNKRGKKHAREKLSMLTNTQNNLRRVEQSSIQLDASLICAHCCFALQFVHRSLHIQSKVFIYKNKCQHFFDMERAMSIMILTKLEYSDDANSSYMKEKNNVCR